MDKLSIVALLAGAMVLSGCADSDSSGSSSKFKDGKSASSTADSTKNADGVAASDDSEKTMALDEPEDSGLMTMTVGDAAPPISISKWIQGEPVASLTPDRVYVVEFWATWCGPCLRSMPHIASLQAEYGDKVAFIGVTAEEDAVVSEFMSQVPPGGDKKWSEILSYRIALDDERKTNAAYMDAAGQGGIPCAFIVGKSSTIEWIGHPMGIDNPLKQVVDGTWDSDAMRTKLKLGPQLDAAAGAGDFKKALALLEPVIKKFPSNNEFQMIQFRLFHAAEMVAEMNKSAAELVKSSNDDARQLNEIAGLMAENPDFEGVNLDVAFAASRRALELTEDKDLLSIATNALVHFRRGEIEEAVAQQKKALEIAENPRHKQQLQESLTKYESALKPASSAAGESKDAAASSTGTPAPAADSAPADGGTAAPK